MRSWKDDDKVFLVGILNFLTSHFTGIFACFLEVPLSGPPAMEVESASCMYVRDIKVS